MQPARPCPTRNLGLPPATCCPQGLEGTVKKIAALHKGAVLSANLQYRVQFVTAVNGNDVKFFAHLVGALHRSRARARRCYS